MCDISGVTNNNHVGCMLKRKQSQTVLDEFYQLNAYMLTYFLGYQINSFA